MRNILSASVAFLISANYMVAQFPQQVLPVGAMIAHPNAATAQRGNQLGQIHGRFATHVQHCSLAYPQNNVCNLRTGQLLLVYARFAGDFSRRYVARTVVAAEPFADIQPPEPQFLVADGPRATRPEQAQVTLEVPALAHVWVEGNRQDLRGTAVRIVSPDLTPGRTYSYSVRVRWFNGTKEEERSFSVPVAAGDRQVLTVVGKSR